VFQRHARADELDRVVRLLLERNLIRIVHEARTQGRGRGKDMYFATECDLSDFSDLSPVDYVSMSKDAAKQEDLRSHCVRPLCDLRSDDHPCVPEPAQEPTPAFTYLAASEVYCAACGQSQPVTPVESGYACTVCGDVVGVVSGEAPADPPEDIPEPPTEAGSPPETTTEPTPETPPAPRRHVRGAL
jgi:hypothetical protein